MANHYREWQFYNPVSLAFGDGVLEKLSLPVHEGRVLIVTTPGSTRRGLTKRVAGLLDGREHTVLDSVTPNPVLGDLEKNFELLKNKNIKCVVGAGGGSVLDTAKVLSFLLNTAGDRFSLRNHLEQQDLLPQIDPLPFIAIPTTAGTGSEVTPFATIWDRQNEKKYSFASPKIFARAALLDPGLTLSLPQETTIVTGLDALSHALESIWNHNSSTITGIYALKAAAIILKTLPDLVTDPGNAGHRAGMMEAALLAGLAISSTRTALAHSISYPVTAHFGMPHGLACAFTLPAVLEYNAGADDGRILETARYLGFSTPIALQEHLLAFFEALNVKRMVSQYVRRVDDLVALAPKMITPGRADNNLRGAAVEDIANLLSCLRGQVLEG